MKKILTLILTLFMSLALFGNKVRAESHYVFYIMDGECDENADACYSSLKEAVDDMNSGDEYFYRVELRKDVDIEETIVIDNKRINLDEHGYSIYNSNNFYNEEEGKVSLFSIKNGGSLTFSSDIGHDNYTMSDVGRVKITATGCNVVDVEGDGSYFSIYTQGDITSDKLIAYIKGGFVSIRGGTYKTNNESTEMFKVDGGSLSISGGWFVGYDPSNYVSNYEVSNENNTYIVGKKHTINIIAEENGTVYPSGDVEVAGEECVAIYAEADRSYLVNKIYKNDKLWTSYEGDRYNGSSFYSTSDTNNIKCEFRSESDGYFDIINSETDNVTEQLNPELSATSGQLHQLLSSNEMNLVQSGEKADVFLTVKECKDEVAVNEAKKLLDERTVGIILDITFNLKVGDNEPRKITDTIDPVQIEIEIPDYLKNQDTTKSRKFTIIRVHEGKAEIIDGYYNENTGILSFSTDKFSTYLISYEDIDIKPADNSDNNTYKDNTNSNESVVVNETNESSLFSNPSSNESSVKKAGPKDINSDGYVSCAEEMNDDSWIWSKEKSACVYKITNTSSK